MLCVMLAPAIFTFAADTHEQHNEQRAAVRAP